MAVQGALLHLGGGHLSVRTLEGGWMWQDASLCSFCVCVWISLGHGGSSSGAGHLLIGGFDSWLLQSDAKYPRICQVAFRFMHRRVNVCVDLS